MIRATEKVSNQNLDTLNKFEKFFDLSPDLLCIAGFDGYFKRVNPAVSKLLGYTTEELMSRPINEFVYPDDQISTNLARNELRSRISLFDFENRYVTKHGYVVWLLWTSLPIESDKLVYAIAKKITYKKELEKHRNLHLAKLTKINNDFKQLTYTGAHDLRSPVNNLLAIFDLLDVSKISDPETLEYISMLKSTTEGLKETLNDYVTLLDKNEINQHIEELNLTETLNEVLFSIKSLIQNSNATINVNFQGLKKINFNKAYLKSIFLNLITNSIKYTKIDCSPIISIYSQNNIGSKELIISDNGIGFDMEQVKDKIFGLHQKFHTNIDGNGIGLYLVYNHITGLGGRISVESKINEGAKFIITFKD